MLLIKPCTSCTYSIKRILLGLAPSGDQYLLYLVPFLTGIAILVAKINEQKTQVFKFSAFASWRKKTWAKNADFRISALTSWSKKSWAKICPPSFKLQIWGFLLKLKHRKFNNLIGHCNSQLGIWLVRQPPWGKIAGNSNSFWTTMIWKENQILNFRHFEDWLTLYRWKDAQ